MAHPAPLDVSVTVPPMLHVGRWVRTDRFLPAVVWLGQAIDVRRATIRGQNEDLSALPSVGRSRTRGLLQAQRWGGAQPTLGAQTSAMADGPCVPDHPIRSPVGQRRGGAASDYRITEEEALKAWIEFRQRRDLQQKEVFEAHRPGHLPSRQRCMYVWDDREGFATDARSMASTRPNRS
jgi:hypothetical protein